MSARILRTAGQFVVIAALFAGVAAFSNWPQYRQTPPDTGVVMLSFVHSADRSGECRRLTQQDLAKLPPNMRKPQECPRGRRPLHVELEVDGQTIYSATLPPTGIAGDGPSKVYQRFVLRTGEHALRVRMRDTARTEGFDHERAAKIPLAPDQMLVIDFSAWTGFVFR